MPVTFTKASYVPILQNKVTAIKINQEVSGANILLLFLRRGVSFLDDAADVTELTLVDCFLSEGFVVSGVLGRDLSSALSLRLADWKM